MIVAAERLVTLREGNGWIVTGPPRISAGQAGHLGSRGPKVPHATYDDALRHADAVATKVRVPMDVYFCVYCEHFHVGSQRTRKFRDDALLSEIGERAFGCLKRENLGKTELRLRQLAAMQATLERVHKRDHQAAI